MMYKILLLIFVISLSSTWAIPLPKSRPFKDPEINPGLFEGDIAGFNPKALQGANIPSLKWPGGVVPYQFDVNLTATEKATFQAAIDDIANKTCIKIKKRTCQKDYISVQKSGGCWTYLGRTGGAQPLSLGDGCWSTGTVQHEFLHTLGFIHEQSRPDRDQYVKINWTNIDPETYSQFDKYEIAQISTSGTAYDYASIMHYHAWSFAINYDYQTIIAPNGITLGQREFLTDIDAYEINVRYNCTAFL